MREERRLVWRVLRHWRGIANRGRFPRRDDIEAWLLGADGRNCLLVAVQSPIELSHFLLVGVNLAVALCATDTLAGVLLSQVPRVVSTRRALMIEGSAMLRKEGILYRGILLPLSENGRCSEVRDFDLPSPDTKRWVTGRKGRNRQCCARWRDKPRGSLPTIRIIGRRIPRVATCDRQSWSAGSTRHAVREQRSLQPVLAFHETFHPAIPQ
jgi:hypothetical protein